MIFKGTNYRTGIIKKSLVTVIKFSAIILSSVILGEFLFHGGSLGGKRHRHFTYGQFNVSHFYQGLVIGILLTFFILVVCFIIQKNKRIIISVTFKDKTNELSITSQTLFSKEIFEQIIPYELLRFDEEYYYDLVNCRNHEAIRIFHKKELEGYLLREHFTWDYPTIRQIKYSLNDLKAAGRLYTLTDKTTI